MRVDEPFGNEAKAGLNLFKVIAPDLWVRVVNRVSGANVDLMSNIVKELKDMGKTDKWIMKHLGMDADEVIRLKQMSGLASLFRNEEFSNSWDIE